MDKVWELLKEILPEFKLSDESSSESKIAMLDAKLKEPVKDSKEFKPEGSMTALKVPEKSDKTPKGKTFHITMSFICMDIVYK